MKNVLFATTALVAFGGAAFADAHEGGPVSFSGSAELGITYTDADGAPNDGIDFVGDYGLDITLSGTSDAGISFGANVEIEHDASNAGTGEDIDDFNVFVSGSFGTLTLGDVDSGFDFVSIGIDTGGLADEADYYAWDSGLDGANDGIILRYDITYSGVTFAASVEQGTGVEDDVYAVGLGYAGSFGSADVGFAVAYTEQDEDEVIHIGASVGFSGLDIKGSYQLAEIGGVDTDTIEASVAYSTGAITVGANTHITTGDVEDESYGVFGEYDLGGGLSLVGAVSTSNISGDDVINAGMGFAMSF
ncbi:porin [Algicella marina]|uniref:Porin n=1 Tax=Algicella marina TaxID=2683284 RepID=A0A6P1T128_9RHOB|nr:porin [Algicella marina]QHQ36614.1 porin [Algicella marina]